MTFAFIDKVPKLTGKCKGILSICAVGFAVQLIVNVMVKLNLKKHYRNFAVMLCGILRSTFYKLLILLF